MLMDRRFNVRRFFLNVGLLGLFVSMFYALILLAGANGTYHYQPVFEVLILAVPSSVVVFIFRKGFEGYKEEFIDRYKRTIIVTAVIQIVTLFYSIFMIDYTDRSVDNGCLGLGNYLFIFFIWIVAALAIAVLWIVSAVRYKKAKTIKS